MTMCVMDDKMEGAGSLLYGGHAMQLNWEALVFVALRVQCGSVLLGAAYRMKLSCKKIECLCVV